MHQTMNVALPGASARIVVSARSEVGHVRLVNEDSFIAQSPLFLVADGMGGHARGDRASQAVVAELGERISADFLPTAADILNAIRTANDAVISLAQQDDGAMSGTTLAGVALVATSDGTAAQWMAFNVGDSRIYSWDGRVLEQLSVDHSAVQELVDAGLLSDEDARVHPNRNVITRAIGARSDVDADVWLLPVAGAQSFLICSDGLTKELDDDEIAELLGRHDDENTIADVLVEAANAAGGRDNITVVAVQSTLIDDKEPANPTI
ncbi:MAG: hypothetical protein JWQ12_1453 [Glaciihabitans sp.]|nr:hypothetical protein [Glaciihabitans sp.]